MKKLKTEGKSLHPANLAAKPIYINLSATFFFFRQNGVKQRASLTVFLICQCLVFISV